MSFWDNVKKFAQPYSDDDYDDYEDEMDEYEEEAEERAPRSGRRPSPFANAAAETTDTYEPAAAPVSTTPSFSGQVLNMAGKQESKSRHFRNVPTNRPLPNRKRTDEKRCPDPPPGFTRECRQQLGCSGLDRRYLQRRRDPGISYESVCAHRRSEAPHGSQSHRRRIRRCSQLDGFLRNQRRLCTGIELRYRSIASHLRLRRSNLNQ